MTPSLDVQRPALPTAHTRTPWPLVDGVRGVDGHVIDARSPAMWRSRRPRPRAPAASRAPGPEGRHAARSASDPRQTPTRVFGRMPPNRSNRHIFEGLPRRDRFGCMPPNFRFSRSRGRVRWPRLARRSVGRRARAGAFAASALVPHAGARASRVVRYSWTTTRVPGFSAVAMTPCQLSGRCGSVQPKSALASSGARFTQPWLCWRPKLLCQKAPWSA